MDIYLDNRPVPWAGELPPMEAIARLLEDVNRKGRVVASIVLDGHPLGSAWEEVYRRIGLGEARQLRLRTMPARQMLWETLIVLVQELPSLLGEIEDVARRLQRGEDNEGFGKLPSLLEKVESYTQFLGALMQHEPAQVATAEQHVSQLTHWMGQVMEAWRREDFVLVADYLEYELAPIFRAGAAWMQELARQKVPSFQATFHQPIVTARQNGDNQEAPQ